MQGTLFVVATPLGNLDDLSEHAVQVLGNVEILACEDTRRTRKLLNHFQIKAHTLSYHEHNESHRAPKLISRLKDGQNIALVSNAGTPQISDPGFRLVRACRQQGIPVFPIPGPSAVSAAISVSGLPSDKFLFVGFLPPRKSSRLKELEILKPVLASLLIFLPPHHLREQLEELQRVLGDRKAFLAKEMTKIHEKHWWGPLSQIIHDQQGTPRGEFTLVIEGSGSGHQQEKKIDIESYVQGLREIRKMTLKEAIREAAKDLGKRRNEVYREVAIKD